MMISRFFKKKPKPAAPKKKTPEKKTMKETSKPKATMKSKKILTAEGWKRMMMRTTSKPKK